MRTYVYGHMHTYVHCVQQQQHSPGHSIGMHTAPWPVRRVPGYAFLPRVHSHLYRERVTGLKACHWVNEWGELAHKERQQQVLRVEQLPHDVHVERGDGRVAVHVHRRCLDHNDGQHGEVDSTSEVQAPL